MRKSNLLRHQRESYAARNSENLQSAERLEVNDDASLPNSICAQNNISVQEKTDFTS